MVVRCEACANCVAYPHRPWWCAYCGAKLPEELHVVLPPAPKYELSDLDRMFLRAILVLPEV